MPKSTAERTREYKARQKEKGLVKSYLWVPADKVDKLHEYARKLRGD